MFPAPKCTPGLFDSNGDCRWDLFGAPPFVVIVILAFLFLAIYTNMDHGKKK